MGIISENGQQSWERRADFLNSFLKSQGKTVSMHGKVQYGVIYIANSEYSEHYEEVMRQMKDKARSEFFSFIMSLLQCLRLIAKRASDFMTQTRLRQTNWNGG